MNQKFRMGTVWMACHCSIISRVSDEKIETVGYNSTSWELKSTRCVFSHYPSQGWDDSRLGLAGTVNQNVFMWPFYEHGLLRGMATSS